MPRFTCSFLILSFAITAAACNKKPQDADVQTVASVQSVTTASTPNDGITAGNDTTKTAQSLNNSDIPCIPREKENIWKLDEDFDAPSAFGSNNDNSDDDDGPRFRLPVPKPNPAKDSKAKDFSDRKPFVFTVSTDIPMTPSNPRARRHSPGFKGKHVWDWIDHLFKISNPDNEDEEEEEEIADDENTKPDSTIKIDSNPKSWKKETIRYLVAVHTVDGKYPLQYDLDCDGDGVYEHKNLKDSFVCKYKYNSGNHQIHLRGDIPAIWLCANGMLIDDPVHGDAIVDKSYLYEYHCEDGVNSENFRCSLPYRQPTVCPASVDPYCNGKGRPEFYKGQARDNFNCKEEYKFCDHGYDAFAEDMYDRVQLVTSIDDWGDIEWKSMMAFAADCARLNQLPPEAPNLTQVKNMSYAFDNADIFDQPLEHWDVSHVEDMTGMFNYAGRFNQPLEKWDISHVKSMENMFFSANKYNQPLESWDISNVRNMDHMFSKAYDFSHYPKNWILAPDARRTNMFSGTRVEKQAEKKPLRQRKYCAD